MKIGQSMKTPAVKPQTPAETPEVQPSAVDLTAKQETEGVVDTPNTDIMVGPVGVQDSGFQADPAETVTMNTPAPNIDLPGTPVDKPVMGTKKGGLLLRGAVAQNAVSTEQTKASLNSSQNQFRFWCPVGGEARVTFIDGNLDADGALDIPYWYEHRLMVGRMIECVCYETDQTLGPCPVCQAGHKTQLVGGLTIINHTPHVIKNGVNAGKELKNRRQMFVAPRTAIETLQKLASKRGGLSGHCFDIYRKENKDPRVGSVFDYVGELTQEQKVGIGEDWAPYNWDEEIKLIDAAEMAKLGGIAVPYGGNPQQGSGGSANLNEIEI